MIKERGHLNELMRNMQSMQNELERSTSESRRRLERQVQLLETTNAELKEKVSSETEQYRQLSLRREVEVKELHARIDKASSDLASTHEALAVAKTSQEHLQARADDLAKQVDAKEEKLAVYEKRTTSSGATSAGQTLSREQQLEIELADLRGELRTAQVEIEQANAHVEQYKAIAQANEEALAQLQSTYDEYKLSTDSSIAAKDVSILARML